MCTNPRVIYTNARYLSDVSKYTLTVPCGRCEECKQNIRNQYMIRAYYESLHCFREHGVCVFDTLTYSDENVPSIYGIKCFRYFDLVLFRKRLRTNLNRAGYDSTKISYFISSEYGDHTARPHYHILIYAWFKGATAHLIHYMINKSWQYGFTDKRVKQVVLQQDGCGALAYVTKYVAKSLGDSEQLEISLKQGIKNLSDKQCKEIFENYEDSFKIKHFQSIGFGEYLLDLLDSEAIINNVDIAKEFFENSRIYMPDKRQGVKFYPLGHYYIYKVMYDRVDNLVTGKKDLYVLNSIGKYWKYRQYIKSRDLFITRFNENKHEICKVLNQNIQDLKLDADSRSMSKCLLESINNNKFDVKGFSEYILFYRNLSWLNSQYIPFEMFSFELDILKDMQSVGCIENRCYKKKFIDYETGEIIEKPYSKEFRNNLFSRRYDIVSTVDSNNFFEFMYPVYLSVDSFLRTNRENDLIRKSKAIDLNRRVRLLSEKIER